MPILIELRRRGHEIAIRSAESGLEALGPLGSDAAPTDPAIEAIEHRDWGARTRVGGSARALRAFGARAPHEAADLRAAISAERPDALLVDIAAWGALAAAEAWAGPWAAFSPLPLPIPSRQAPPFGPGFRPARGRLGRMRDRLTELLSEAAAARLVFPPVNAMRASLGLPALKRAEEMFLCAPLVLYTSAEPFEYPRNDWPENVVLVGPCSWEPAAELPEELRGVDGPLVLVTTSSDFQADGGLVSTALSALAEEPCHVVATLPSTKLEGLLPPANATVLGFAPHAPILARASCAITHGGMGATQKALAHGVPVCAVPFGRDQYEVARRVEVAGAGTRLPAWRLRPERLRAKYYEAIACRAGAERVARSFAERGGASSAVDAFEIRALGARR